MNFEDLPDKLKKMLEALKQSDPSAQHIEIMKMEDLEKLQKSIPILAAGLPKLAFANGALLMLYTGFVPTIPSLMMTNQEEVDKMFKSPVWTYNVFKTKKWHPDTQKGVLRKGDRICVALHHLKGLTVSVYHVQGMKKVNGDYVIRSEFAGGASYPFRLYSNSWDELPVDNLHALADPSAPATAVAEATVDWSAGLEDLESFENWEAPAGPDYFKG